MRQLMASENRQRERAEVLSAHTETARRESEEELRRMVRELEASNADLRRFTSVAAHQLRSPPRTISGIATALREDYGHLLDADGRQFIQDILTDADNMADVVDGLHRFSKTREIEAGELEPVNLNIVMQEILDSKSKSGGWQDSIFEWGELPTVQGDKVLLTEVFANLVENGFKFNRSPIKRVRVSWTIPSRCSLQPTCPFLNKCCWCIKVEDNGIGIDPRYRHKLFTMFERLSPEFPGTGVGLAMVRTILRKIGGEITLQSELNTGTTFCVGLPMVQNLRSEPPSIA